MTWQFHPWACMPKGLNDPDNHDGVIIHLEPDILKSEVKWALVGIPTNKASGGDGIPVKLFQILKMMLLKCCTQYASKFGTLSSGHRTGKKSVFTSILKKGNAKECSNYPTVALMPARLCSKSIKLGFNST